MWGFFAFGVAAFGGYPEWGSVGCEIWRDLRGAKIAVFILEADIVETACSRLSGSHTTVYVVPDGHYGWEVRVGPATSLSWRRVLDLVLGSSGQKVVGGHGYEDHSFLDAWGC